MPRSPGTYFPGRGTLVEETYLEGKAHGFSDAVLRVFEVRGIALPEAVARHIEECTDPATLRWWLDHGATVVRAGDQVRREAEAEDEGPPTPPGGSRT
ncbi:hypothetical protein [Streptomyces sp. NPDC053431]|uniref:hypothetical protein n=1 Tax=Streptomyces sp. NPDC053431 TaxID=3365703 RepID=UPI0037D41526